MAWLDKGNGLINSKYVISVEFSSDWDLVAHYGYKPTGERLTVVLKYPDITLGVKDAPSARKALYTFVQKYLDPEYQDYYIGMGDME